MVPLGMFPVNILDRNTEPLFRHFLGGIFGNGRNMHTRPPPVTVAQNVAVCPSQTVWSSPASTVNGSMTISAVSIPEQPFASVTRSV